MLDDRDHRAGHHRGWTSRSAGGPATNASLAAALRHARQSERDLGCAFWAAAMGGGLFLLLAGYGLAALVDGATAAVLP